MRILLIPLLFLQIQAVSSPDSLKAGDIVINEIMADPDPSAGSLTYPEYVELYNRTSKTAVLKNWKCCIGTTCKTLPDIAIPSDSFLVLSSPASLKLFPLEINALGITGFPALTNTGQLLQLINSEGNIIHAISYTLEWYGDALKAEGGYSLEQLDASNPCAERENWRACAHPNGGTPGKKNSAVVINNDTRPPEILRIVVLQPDCIQVIFSESLDSTTLMDVTAYHITSMGHPILLSRIKPFFKSIVLVLGDSLKKSFIYTLTVEKQIRDCAGNVIKSGSSAKFAIPAAIEPNDVVINEVLFNPRPGGVDFVEIYNRSHHVLDLKNLLLCHYDSLTHHASDVERIITTSYLFFPNEYLVLTEHVETVKKQYKTENPDAFLNIEVLPSMAADEGNIALKTISEMIDQFTYRDNMHFALLKETRGISLERVHFERSSDDVTNWHSASSSVDFATPGYKNSQFIDGLLTEHTVTVYPEIFSPDEDGVDDQVTIQYQLSDAVNTITVLIYDDQGRLVRTLVNNQLIGVRGSYSWDGINDFHEKEGTGVYVIFIRIRNHSGRINVYKKICVLSGKN